MAICSAQAAGRATCAWSIRRWMPEDRRARIRTQGRVLRHRIRDHRAGQRDGRLAGQAARESRTSRMLVSHVLVPPAMAAILQLAGESRAGISRAGSRVRRDGVRRVRAAGERYQVPIVITGFEPIDMLEGILMAVRQLKRAARKWRTSTARGAARRATACARTDREVFEVGDRKWRGIGMIPQSGLQMRYEFRDHDAESGSKLQAIDTAGVGASASADMILHGIKKPHDCPAFGDQCTPQHPLGATMVSAEGACAAYYAYGRHSTRRGPGDAGGERR